MTGDTSHQFKGSNHVTSPAFFIWFVATQNTKTPNMVEAFGAPRCAGSF
jgi:hypothetical protein